VTHRLDPLLRPSSIAVLGASERHLSLGWQAVHNLLAGGFKGNIYPLNPGYDTVQCLPCYPNLAALPETVDHVIFAIGDHHIEAALDEVISHGAQAATIMSQLIIGDDTVPSLQQRVEKKIRESGLLVCGANCMGFYNCHDGVWVSGFDTRENHVRGGNVTLISHSGAGMCGIVDCEERIDFNLAVSTGQELCVGMHDYMDFAIEAHDTRVIGLFMETVRNPQAMIAVLQKANEHRIPVVALKVGRTDFSAHLAVSHSGAMAGSDSAYQALFDRYGVQRVYDMDEFATALIMFAQPHPVADGGLVCLHDSGGERQMLIDLADRMDVPLARMNTDSTTRLELLLDPGLPAVNPLDAWGKGGPDSNQVMQDCMATMMNDPDAAIGAVVHDRAPLSAIYPKYVDYLRAANKASGKPVFLVANRQGTGTDPAVIQVTREGFPILDGLRSFLSASRCLLDYRDFCKRAPINEIPVDHSALMQARIRLSSGETLDEADASSLLGSFGLPVNPAEVRETESGIIEAARKTGFPVVLKTAERGIRHKTEHRGVHLDIVNEEMLSQAYRDLSERLGPSVMVAPCIDYSGVEMVLGMVRDKQFGPLVMLGFGGLNVEILKDVVFAIPPFDAMAAKRMLHRLKYCGLLERQRDGSTPSIESFCQTAADFSAVVAALGEEVEEIDMNPVIVHANGCIALDALILCAIIQ
jgi:acyl-CoA synthetase (NDP forming)